MANMKVVYTLRQELARDPEHLQRTQALSLDKSRPLMGLATTLGLYGSAEWWRNVEAGGIRRERYRGVIRSLYVAGQDEGDEPNSFEIESNGGLNYHWGIVADDEMDKPLYCVGRWAEIDTIFVELKRPKADGAPDFHEEPFKISLSIDPIA
jgi:hypothetical protein